MLLFARKKDLRLRSLVPETPNYDVVIPVDGIKSAIAISWDNVTNTIFWTDTESSSISSAKINGTDQRKVIDNNLGRLLLPISPKFGIVFLLIVIGSISLCRNAYWIVFGLGHKEALLGRLGH